MKNIKQPKIAITVVTGFLGSGKTTFLSNYVKYLLNKNENPSIIVNEYSNLDVDSNALSHDIEVASILNGCICCDLQRDLIKQLKHFINKSAMHHIIIEATGIAHPVEIIAACQDPEIVEHLATPVVIGLADAPRFLARAQYTNSTIQLMEEQLQISHAIVVNKMDLLESVEYDKIKEIEKINPQAPKFYTSFADLDMDNLVLTTDDSMSPLGQSMHHHGIKSMQYQFTGPIDRQLFYQFILRLPDNVLRLKGYVKFHDAPNDIYEFQYAFGLPDYEVIDTTMPLTIVLIGEQIDENQLRNKLDMLQFT
ncbi:cobalamin biosynthesis protein CobW [Staphylococcus xylosus]|uniref:CobW family GTP-binding protein n=1 Tax=Staphylococcus pseudoxylosus TaxID=2282419 RepID=UPI000D1D4F34|nr:GTP-binding protein [Staphylococcus pseudoxylosus]PTI45730.1 cobalamin biosynthesis protein CobW [Staphylococcus xylosus]MEB6045722.1 GTP-binding protein [Staphylococcus pseudoxylosus]MEB6061648.1 GTP-binding protein [Staphylococcus pseudoxylosus]MEB7753406.1 GTP-binding protein [Staphylococcus pseudoxylosus]MEB8008599.1 GTP-binding protein [Staphylococcus pseudoxylosus]